jgi:hypothetical protein
VSKPALGGFADRVERGYHSGFAAVSVNCLEGPRDYRTRRFESTLKHSSFRVHVKSDGVVEVSLLFNIVLPGRIHAKKVLGSKRFRVVGCGAYAYGERRVAHIRGRESWNRGSGQSDRSQHRDWGQTFYGVPDSGLLSYHSVFNSAFNGPRWLTGGTVGPEASIFTPIALLAVGLIFSRFCRENPYQELKPRS